MLRHGLLLKVKGVYRELCAPLKRLVFRLGEPHDSPAYHNFPCAAGLILAPDISAQTSQPPAPNRAAPAAGTAKDALNQEDNTFVKEAGIGGMAEVELSKLAQKSENADVKNFADRMIRDHTKANQELTTIARGLGVDMPKALDPEHERMRQKLQTLHGKPFDEQYMQGMVDDHNNVVKLFQQEERSGSNATLKQFAQKTSPVLQEHQTMAIELSQKVSKTTAK
jgi:putative membrane protein